MWSLGIGCVCIIAGVWVGSWQVLAETPPANLKALSVVGVAEDPAPSVAEGPAPEFGLGERQDVVQWSHDSQRL